MITHESYNEVAKKAMLYLYSLVYILEPEDIDKEVLEKIKERTISITSTVLGIQTEWHLNGKFLDPETLDYVEKPLITLKLETIPRDFTNESDPRNAFDLKKYTHYKNNIVKFYKHPKFDENRQLIDEINMMRYDSAVGTARGLLKDEQVNCEKCIKYGKGHSRNMKMHFKGVYSYTLIDHVRHNDDFETFTLRIYGPTDTVGKPVFSCDVETSDPFEMPKWDEII